jgi:glutamate carboxypeptidase
MMEQRLGSSATLIDSVAGPHVHWVGGGEPKVLIVGHHDTVFPKGALAQRPFTVDGDKATGPGIFDMKAGIVQAIHGVAALADKSGVEILITSDEEVGSVHSRDLIIERAKACGANFANQYIRKCRPGDNGDADGCCRWNCRQCGSCAGENFN